MKSTFTEFKKQYEKLIPRILKANNLSGFFQDQEEAHQIGLIGLWKAWKIHDGQKSSGSGFVYQKIKFELLDHANFDRGFSSRAKYGRYKELVGKGLISSLVFSPLKELIPKGSHADQDSLALQDLINLISNALTEKELKILEEILNGKSMAELAEERGVTTSRISQINVRIRIKIEKELKRQEIFQT